MRKIIALEFLSLDGVMQAPGGPEEDTSGGFKYGGWTFPYFDESTGKVMEEQMAGEYDLLLGRVTYDIFAGYWPEHSNEWPQVNKITKYVVSNSLKDTSWENSKILKGADDVKKLKEEDGPPLQIYGSGNLLQTLLKENLVDELWLKIFPVTLGNGKKLFAEGTIPEAWKLLDGKVFPNGLIVVNYKREGEVKTGSFV